MKLKDGRHIDMAKSDMKIYREKIGEWQEAYIDKLCKKYVELLQSDKLPSDKFWELEKRLKSDKKHPGVTVTIDKDEMIYDIVKLIRDDAITLEDLDEFSNELRGCVQRLLSM